MILKNINLIDGTGNDIQKNIDIKIENNVIAEIGKNLNGDDVIEGNGQYLLPGMIDSHVHVMLEMEPLENRLSTPFSYNFYKAIDHLKRTVDAGVTTVRDALGADLGLKEAVNDGIVLGPRLQISINALTITGGHGDSYTKSGIHLPLLQDGYPGMPSGLCDGVNEVRKKAREMLRAGADVLKVHATGGVTSATDHPDYTQFSVEELKVIVEEAQFRNNRKVMAHAQGLQGVKQCIEAGIHSIEHGIYLDDEAVKLMKEKDMYLVPTLLAPLSVIEFAAELGMSENSINKSKQVMQDHIESFKKAHQAGVKIAMGTDAGVFKHGTNLRELELMVEHGMTEMEAIVSSTKTAAECLGYDEELGTIEEGKKADFILLEQNPLDDIAVLRDPNKIKVVAIDGKIVKDIR
ncbi:MULTISPECIES: amidohydrolase family protein [Mammaliicoccus]|uniref:Amidohydrolase family protein n=1 Tax=Mammaliicoccus fleurettii TaxID=150056 RepID=A0ABS5MPI5_9STAP|nr:MULTISPECIES: amidohydrolase family protein [Mammaliicoccus]MBL0848100.1 amidohydrolase family protein [Mammaliicoccus fleurettii]MBS3671986.1 amidohydrolase family protein [Mammaliicoccus fleurettii]MBS3697844.1 amidohydrolase family protein [Mammaliicoccus fleurettii]MBW0765117.1 amidohydrolase family protein [Mammaliicoccus fleurettii]MEB8067875.1 amidohydrolase family protein [Mammaliicoccus fleurettii]